MAKTDEEKAAAAAEKAEAKKAAEALKTMKAEGKEKDLDTVECICSNVHIGDGKILRAYRESTDDNWDNGDVAQIPHADAVFLAKRKQVKIL